jgi:hypothetical protein
MSDWYFNNIDSNENEKNYFLRKNNRFQNNNYCTNFSINNNCNINNNNHNNIPNSFTNVNLSNNHLGNIMNANHINMNSNCVGNYNINNNGYNYFGDSLTKDNNYEFKDNNNMNNYIQNKSLCNYSNLFFYFNTDIKIFLFFIFIFLSFLSLKDLAKNEESSTKERLENDNTARYKKEKFFQMKSKRFFLCLFIYKNINII